MKSNKNVYDNQVLSIEMMKKLEEAGIDTSDASCIWHSYVDDEYNPISWMPIFRTEETKIDILRQAFPKTYKEGNLFYCYTLTDILSRIPKRYEVICSSTKVNITIIIDEETGECHQEVGEKLIEVAYNMVIWCKENGYL